MTAVINGVIGPRGDGYVVDATMAASEAAALPRPAGPGVRRGRRPDDQRDHHDLRGRGDRRHPRGHGGQHAGRDLAYRRDRRQAALGQAIGDAITQIDVATDGGPAYYMLNCAHPSHFRTQLDVAAGWTTRIKGVRANASRRSHAELDAATELDRGDIAELAQLYAALQTGLDLRVVGGCCGTDDEHIGAIAAAVGLVEDPR